MARVTFQRHSVKIYFSILHLKQGKKSYNIDFFLLFRYGGTQATTFCGLMTLWHQLHFEGGVDIYQLGKLAHYNRPGIFKTPEDLLFLYCALEAYVTNNGTTIPSPVDIDAWRNSASGYQLNGCVRVSRVYTDSVAKVGYTMHIAQN